MPKYPSSNDIALLCHGIHGGNKIAYLSCRPILYCAKRLSYEIFFGKQYQNQYDAIVNGSPLS